MDFELKYKARKKIEKLNVKSVIELLEKFGIRTCWPILMKNSVYGEDLLGLTRDRLRSWLIDPAESSKLLELIAYMKENPEYFIKYIEDIGEEDVFEDATHVYEDPENTKPRTVENATLTLQEQIKHAVQEIAGRDIIRGSNQNQNADGTSTSLRKNNSRMQNTVPKPPSIPTAPKPKLLRTVYNDEVSIKSTNFPIKSASGDSNKTPDKLPKIVPFMSTKNIANKPLPKLPSEENIDRIQDTKFVETPHSEEEVIYDKPDDDTYQNYEDYVSDNFDESDTEEYHDTEQSGTFYINGSENSENRTEPPLRIQEGGTVNSILTELERNNKFARNNSRANNAPNSVDDRQEYVPMTGKVLKKVRKFSDAKSKFDYEPKRVDPLPKIILGLSNAADKPIPKLPSDGDLSRMPDFRIGRVTKPVLPNNPVERSSSMKAQSPSVRKLSGTQSRNQLPTPLPTDFQTDLTQRLNRFATNSINDWISSLSNSERDLQGKASTSSSNCSVFDNPDYLVPVTGIPDRRVDELPIVQETYFKDVPRDIASRMLADEQDGTFLIRPSKNNEGYTLMVRYNRGDFNIKIRQRESDGKYALGTYTDGEIAFSSIQSMIRYYSSGIEKLTLFAKSKIYGHTHLYPI